MVAIYAALIFGVQSPPPGIIGQHVARIGDRIYLAGGTNDRDPLPSTWEFDPSRSAWTQRADWTDTRLFGVAAEHKGKFYIFGGITNDGSHSNRIDVYDPVANKWSMVGVMPETMTRAAGVVWREKLYMSGGYNGMADRRFARNSASFWEYDFAKAKWKSLKAMRFPRHGHCMVAFGGRIWSIGGFVYIDGAEKSVESYDLTSNAWRAEQSLPVERGFFGADVIGGKLVAFGQLFKPTHPVEWSPSGWRERSTPDLPIRRFSYLQGSDGILVFGGEVKGAPFQSFKP